MTLKVEQNPETFQNYDTGSEHEMAREDTGRHGKTRNNTARHKMARKGVSYSKESGGEEVQILSGMMFEIKSAHKNCLYRMFGKILWRGFNRKIC